MPGASGSDILIPPTGNHAPISGVSDIAFDSGGRYLVAGFGSPPGLLIRDLEQGIDISENAIYRVTGLDVAPFGNLLVEYCSAEQAIGGGELTASSWSLDGLATLWAMPHEDGISGVPRFLPDGERIVFCLQSINFVASPFCSLTIHAVATGKLLHEFESPIVGISEPAISPSGEFFVVLAEQSLLVWKTDGNIRPTKKIVNDTRKHFTGIAFHPSGRFLAATSNDQTVKLYDTQSWELAKTFTWDIGRMRSIAFSPDGTLAAAGGDTGKVVVWDVDL
jgi:WD40 repeat protein